MIAFFTTIGFAASLSLLRVGGPQVLHFFLLVDGDRGGPERRRASASAQPLGQHPLMGVLAGSVTLTGGPATGLAFAPEFAAAGVAGAATLAVAAAMVGIVAGGLMGGPIGTALVERRKLRQTASAAGAIRAGGRRARRRSGGGGAGAERARRRGRRGVRAAQDARRHPVRDVDRRLVSTWIQGTCVPEFLPGLGGRPLTLPAYIGAMLVAAIIRNIDDLTGLIGLSQRLIDDLGSVALSLFLALALMSLKLWELAGLAAAAGGHPRSSSSPSSRSSPCSSSSALMGRDYEAAVMSSGFVGFMLGTTANAMANMEAMVQRFGPAPRAFLVVPMVGAFFIDFANAILITVFLNVYR